MIAAVIPDRRVFRSGRDFAAVGRRREKRGLGAAPGGQEFLMLGVATLATKSSCP
jgi:hypothetical protein